MLFNRFHRFRLSSRRATIRRPISARSEVLEPRIVLASDPIISEFQAINGNTLLDADGDSSDWIELQNLNSEEFPIQGWYLTDDADDLTKWQMPSVNIPANGQLTVFASGKNRTETDSELHTNFKLSGAGEYLALVRPDGTTVAQDFGKEYPAQTEDRSYGLAQNRQSTILVGASSSFSALVPSDNQLALTWTATEFNDNDWTSGQGAVGFEQLRPASTITESFDQPLSDEWTIDLAENMPSEVSVQNGALKFVVPPDQDTTGFDRGTAPIVFRDLPIENATDWELVAHIRKASAGDRGSVGIMIYDEATGKPALMLEQSVRRAFKLFSGGTVSEWTQPQGGTFFLRLARNEFDKTWTAAARVNVGDDWHVIATVTDGTFAGPVVTNPKPALFARTPVGDIEAEFLSVDFNFSEQRPTYGPLLDLDVGESMKDKNSSVYLRYPFEIQGDVNRFDILNFGARFDDGYRAFLNGVEISSQNSPIGATWNSAAAGVHGAVLDQIPLAQADVSTSRSLLQSGQNVLAIQGMNVAADDSDFLFHGGLVASEIVSLEPREFLIPTPGAPNVAPAAPSPAVTGDGVFFGSKTIELTLGPDAPPNMEIRYTLDGTEPTANANLYVEPFTITETSLLQARTFDTLLAPNFQPSVITAKTFIGMSAELQARTSNLPLMAIDTLGQGIPSSFSNDLRKSGVILLDVNESTDTSSFDNGLVEYLGRGGIRRRGSSTGAQAKPQLAFETWGPDGTNRDDDFDATLLGLSPESDWVLHAPFGNDPTFMRNAMGFELSNQMEQWAPGTRFIEVYLNNGGGNVSEEDYVGVYVLIERIKPGPGRLDISTIERSDDVEPFISGGYIWKQDRPDPDAPGFPVGGNTLNWVYPESPLSLTASEVRKATDEQQRWVQQYFADFQQTLSQPDINDPEGYSKFIDVDAWVDYHLMQAFVYNADAMGLSIFYHKDRDGKIAAGPLWDLNLTIESRRIDDDNPTLWRTGANFFGAHWWNGLVQDPGFWQRYADRWHGVRQTVFTEENMNNLVDRFASQIGDSANRNAVRWPDNSYREVSGYNSGFLDGTFQGEVKHMKHWMQARAEFFDSLFVSSPQILIDEIPIDDVGVKLTENQQVSFAVSQSVSTDTRLLSGVPGETIARYFIPSNDDLGDTWTEPGFNDSDWASGPTGLGFERRDNFAEFLRTNVDPRVVEDATTFFARMEFNVDDLNSLMQNDLVLRMMYEDGYMAYLNGTRVARENVPSNHVSWNTKAINQSTANALLVHELDITRFKNLLVEGKNVLAFRVLNSTAGSGEMLLLPELVARQVSQQPDPGAVIYYTTDGTDPRASNGMPSPNAIRFQGESFTVSQNSRIVARNLDEADRGHEAEVVLTDWSPPTQINLVTDSTPIVISEIHYNPLNAHETEMAGIPDANGDGLLDWGNDDFEFMEIYNPGPKTVNLVGLELNNGVAFDFTNATQNSLEAGEFGIVVNNREAFQLRYGQEINPLGEYTGNLNNNGERVTITDGTGEILSSVQFGDNDPWPVRADGFGASLEINDVNTPLGSQNKSYAWRASTELHGSPGVSGTGPIGVVVNEIISRTNAPTVDSIELLNATDQAIEIGGWHLSDSANQLFKFEIPAGTMLAAQSYVVFDETDFNVGADNFALDGAQGDSVWLVAHDADGKLQFVDDVHFRGSSPGESWGRSPNAGGRLSPMVSSSFGGANGDVRVGPVVISEIHYNPGNPSVAALEIDPTLTSGDLEFVEIFNPTQEDIDLNDWRIRGGIDYDFEDGVSLAKNGAIVVIRFNPRDVENMRRLTAFKAHYQLSDSAMIVGGYAGQLSNSEEKIELLHPEPPIPEQPNTIVRFQEDEVVYDDVAPWPTDADGMGSSLNRKSTGSVGNLGNSWRASAPTPGSFLNERIGDFDQNGIVDANDIDLLFEQLRAPMPDSDFDLTGDGLVNTSDRDLLIEEVLGTDYGDANLDGVFNSRDLVLIFEVGEYEDNIPGNSTWSEGDWNGDGEFGSRDLVLAFVSGGFVFASDQVVPQEFSLKQASIISAMPHSRLEKVQPENEEPDNRSKKTLERQLNRTMFDRS